MGSWRTETLLEAVDWCKHMCQQGNSEDEGQDWNKWELKWVDFGGSRVVVANCSPKSGGDGGDEATRGLELERDPRSRHYE